MKKRKILIAGSNGMLGKDIVNFFEKYTSYEIYGINRNYSGSSGINQLVCDLTNEEMTRAALVEIKPDIIINCAANINLNECEQEKDLAYKINAEAAKNLASFQPLTTKNVFISTDAVFNGIDGNYTEESETDPLNYYAYTKLQGEKLVRDMSPNNIVIRTNIYGFNYSPKNSLVEWAMRELRRNKIIDGFADVYFTPLYTKQLAEAIWLLLQVDYAGIINVGSKQSLSKYEFLIKLADQFKIDTSLINKISVDGIKSEIKRPKKTNLNTDRMRELIGKEFDIDEGIGQLYEDYFNWEKEGS